MATIRTAIPNDAEPLARLAERTFRDAFAADNKPADMDSYCANHFSAKIQRQEIKDPNSVILVAELDGALVAFAHVRLDSPQPCVAAEQPSELKRLYVLEQWHGRGIAQEVMREVLASTAHHGADALWLGVWEHNPKAIAFYRKYGFKVVGDHLFHMGEDPQRDLIMAVKVEDQPLGQ